MDEGLCLSHIELAARGQRPYFDFLDAYGPLHTVGPALAWKLSGGKVWGVRVWVWAIKLATVVLGTWIVGKLAGRVWGLVGLLLSTILLGLPWQPLQTPYAALHCAPLILATYGLLVVRPLARDTNEVLAALCTGTVLLIKINAGAFLLAGGLLYTACISPDDGERRPWITSVQWTLLALCSAAFLLYVAEPPDLSSYVYLHLPLLAVTAWVGRGLIGARRSCRGATLRHAGVYLLVSAGAVLAGLLVYFGASTPRYLIDSLTLLASIDYVRPFPLPWQAGVYPDYGRYLWPQMPWFGLFAFVLWWALTERPERYPSDGRIGGVWVMATLGSFVLRALATEIHAIGAAWTMAPPLVVLVAALAREVERRLRTTNLRLQMGAAGLLVAWSATLFERPTLGRLVPQHDFSVGSRRSPADNRLAGLRFREATPRGERAGRFPETASERDRHVDEAAKYIDTITEDGEAVLMTTHAHILHVHSFTEQVGGRYRFLLYLAHTGVLDGRALQRLAPGLLRSIVATPPRVIVSSVGYVAPLVERLPELRQLSRRFVPARTFGSILVLVRDDVRLNEEESK
jgi:hypothetical protein